MAIDLWGPTNQGLANLTSTMGTLAQLKRQDQQYADEAPLRALQIQQAQQGVEQGNLTLANLKGQQNAMIGQYGTQDHTDPIASAYELQAEEEKMQKAQAAKQKGFEVYLNTIKALDGMTNLDAATKTEIGKHFLSQNPDYAPFADKLNYVDSKGVKAARQFGEGELKDPVTGQPLPAGYYETEGVWTGDATNPVKLTAYKLVPEKPDAEALLDKRLAAQEKNTQRQIDAADRRAGMKAAKPATAGHGGMNIKMNGLNPNQTSALTAAIGEGRLDPYKINSKNQQILADAAIANPGINLNDMAANLGLARNKDVQMKGAIAETVPPLLKSIVENGKKLNYSNNQFLGMAQQYIDKKTNNPQFVKYMTLRNDQLLTLGGIMRSNGMTDMAQRLEEEAAHPTMSPRALEGWLAGQMESVNPRLNIYRSIREGKGAPRSNSSANSGSYSDLLNKHKR